LNNNYCIKKDYISRTEYIHFDDSLSKDEWQLEVYLHALGLMKKHNFSTVIDVGCGSGYKLITYLGEYQTIGLELSRNLEALEQAYPGRKWLETNINCSDIVKTDVLICSDVIEHVENPNDLVKFLSEISFEYLVLSTPDRDLVYQKGSRYLDGPPRNVAHQREWNFSEFNQYISQFFTIIDHRITNLQQATQTMICRKNTDSPPITISS